MPRGHWTTYTNRVRLVCPETGQVIGRTGHVRAPQMVESGEAKLVGAINRLHCSIVLTKCPCPHCAKIREKEDLARMLRIRKALATDSPAVSFLGVCG